MERPTPERVIIPYLGQRRTKKPRSFQGGEERRERERGIARVLTMCRVFFQTSYKKKKIIKFHASSERGKSVKVRAGTAQPRSKDFHCWKPGFIFQRLVTNYDIVLLWKDCTKIFHCITD